MQLAADGHPMMMWLPSTCHLTVAPRLLLLLPAPATAACPLWKKVKQSGSVAHLGRWFDHHAALPACTAAAEELCPTKKREAAAAADAAAGKGGGGKLALLP